MPERLDIRTSGDRELVITRRFAAPPQLVFACWTRPELVRRWLLGPDGWVMTTCEIDARVGGNYRYVWHHATQGEMGVSGTIHELEFPRRLVSTELFDEDWTGGEARSTIVLTEETGGTLMKQTCLYSSSEARRGALASGMADGLGAGFDRLDGILAETPAGS